MKKRFSSLNPMDMAAWLMAIGTFAFLAGAGLAINWLRKGNLSAAAPRRESRTGSHPNLTPGT